ncbi:alpha/beta hydrolase [Pseudonocardia ailaonensis]|uniref:Alpha/beta hydrolase n=1 Tax=Pseudonocardia ailaonensis TaxID=367279 RepID=A0ABN2N7Z2_9PSEU
MTDPRIALLGGRRVAYEEYGDPTGHTVFVFHGTPDSRIGKGYLDPLGRERNLRIVSPDRPGIGRSDPRPDRTVASYAGEVLGLADALGAERFAVLGYSGGGPYAMACATGCGPRLTAAATMAGAGPVDDREGAREGLSKSDLELLDLALRDPRAGARQLRIQKLAVQLFPQAGTRSMAGELDEPDRAVLTAVSARETMSSFVESLRQGPGGVLLDYRLWGSPWELDWTAATAPVHLFQGDRDRMVPMHHAEDLAGRLPAGLATLHVVEGAGHLSIVGSAGEVLDSLVP